MTDRGRAGPAPARDSGRIRPRAAWPLWAFVLAGLAGCASTPQTGALLDERPAGLPAHAELDSTPFFPQERYQCGPAALATVLSYGGRPTEPAELVDEVYIPEREGTLRTELRAATRARGLVPYPLAPELEAVLREVAGGNPVLVMQNLGLDWYPQWHFAVVVGHDLERGEVVLRSGTQRRRVTSLKVFERTWSRSGRWAQVVTAPDEPPPTAEPLAWLRAVRELEGTDPDAALRGYRAATARWPGSGEAWMARGNAVYERDRTHEARTSFLRAVEAAPDRVAGWNNLAYTLAATGCGTAAREAARCAVRLAPGKPGPRDTLDDIKAMETGATNRCELPACPADPH